MSFTAHLANASHGGVELSCLLDTTSLAAAGVGALGGYGRYLFDISGPGSNVEGWTSSNLTVDLYRDFTVEAVSPSVARNDRSTVLTIVGGNFIPGLMCRFVDASLPLVNTSDVISRYMPMAAGLGDEGVQAINKLWAGFEAAVVNETVALCEIPPVPVEVRGLYRLELSGNKQQVCVCMCLRVRVRVRVCVCVRA